MKFTPSIIIPRKKTNRPRMALRSTLCVLLALLFLPLPGLATGVPTSMRVAMVVPKDMELYPLKVMDRDAVSLLNLVYEGLVELDDTRQPVPLLATGWEQSNGGSTWVFTIRQGVYFHDGRELSAYDVGATIDAIKEMVGDTSTNTIPTPEMGLYSMVAYIVSSWEAEDDGRTLRIRTSRPFYALPYVMTFPVLQAQSKNQINPPGTGPYRVEMYLAGDELWLTGNQVYWKQVPYIRDITGVWFENDEAALRAFEAETIDILMTRSASAMRYRGTVSSRASSYDFATRQLECLIINNAANSAEARALKDVKMRQAIAYAISKSRLSTAVYQDTVTITDTIQSPASWLYNDLSLVNHGEYTYPYNPEEANKLLDDLGWSLIDDKGYRYKKTESGTTQLTLRLYYYDEAGNALRKDAANEIATMLRAVGIRVNVRTYSFADGAAKLKSGDFDLFLCAYNFDIVPDPNFMLLPNGYGNYARYRSDDMSKLCQALRKAYEKDEFLKIWQDIQVQMAQDVAFIPLYWRNGIILTRYPYSSVRDIREFELLKSIDAYK